MDGCGLTNTCSVSWMPDKEDKVDTVLAIIETILTTYIVAAIHSTSVIKVSGPCVLTCLKEG